MPAPPPPPRAALLLIGNELLSGKIRDENGWHLARFLRRRGIALCEVAVVPDDDERIAAALTRLRGQADLLFTSGGVGPTHDDRTLPAIAKATGRPLARNDEMAAMLRAHYGERLTPEALAMADVPAGTVPRALPGWPVLRLDLGPPAPARLYILPGVPELFRAKLERLAELPGELPEGPGWCLHTLDLTAEESRLAGPLAELAARFPEVEIGSYPRWSRDAEGRLRGRVRVTFEAPAAHADQVEAARDELARAFAGELAGDEGSP